jgi:tetratricopeptide (TPR) repeat protein
VLKFILPAIIFLSLAIIIFILAKRLPDFRKANGNKKKGERTESEITEEIHKEKIRGFFGIFFMKIGKFFVFIAEEIVKRLKKLLHLIHFWLIKLKRKEVRKNKIQEEMDAKEELVKAEEKNLENVINVNLRQPEEIDLKDEQREREEQEKIKTSIEQKRVETRIENLSDYQIKEQGELGREERIAEEKKEEIDGKVKGFFGEGESLDIEKSSRVEIPEDGTEEVEEEKKTGFLSRFVSKFKKGKKEDLMEDGSVNEKTDQEGFSDGIVKVEQYEKTEVKEDLLMKEVVTVSKKDNDLDEELGVDRKILERKILQKITQNPRAAENYRQLGELYIKMENYSEAQECYQQILKIQVRDIDANKKLEKIKLLKRLGRE